MRPEWLGKMSIQGTRQETVDLLEALLQNVKAGADPTLRSTTNIWVGFAESPWAKLNQGLAGFVWGTHIQLEEEL